MRKGKKMFKELQEFGDYVNSFYGQGGIYAKSDYATVQQIETAIMTYMSRLTELVTWGGGDSLDRERVSVILTEELNVNLY
jgi:hypothetical protein|tara:strand:- start:61 stop:303 length:243 start_codon:yes stop_codon:yes gene_type:complete